MYVDGDHVVTSPSDLSTWAACEWAFVRRLDAKLGRIEAVAVDEDDMLKRTAVLGIAHEERYLEGLRARYGAERIVEFTDRPSPSQYREAAEAARAAMERGVDVLYQATFFDGWFLGFSDFLIRNDAGAYEVYDTKLARHAKIPALLQLAGYAEQIAALGLPVGDRVHLVLGDNSVSSHDLRDLLPVYRVQLARLRGMLAARLTASGAVEWGDPGFAACGRCTACTAEVEKHRDLVLVAGMRLDQRSRLVDAGITTIDDLAASTGPVDGLSNSVLTKLRRQAAAQIATSSGAGGAVAGGAVAGGVVAGGAGAGGAASSGAPAYEVLDARALGAIPPPDDGDLFFDFEGDPLYTEDNETWGLDYLFGSVEADETFVPFWAYDLAAERQALIDFLAYVGARRAAHPGMHVYHYASYERTHLLSLAARHGVGEEQVDELLRDNVLVDLYPIVRQGLVIGSHSYSLKKLEPLYMDTTRAGYDVANAADSIQAYVDARAEQVDGDPVLGQRMLDQVGAYNEYDCVSTLRLRDWLLEVRASAAVEGPGASGVGSSGSDGSGPGAFGQALLDLDRDVIERIVREPDPVYVGLMAHLEGVDALDRTPDQTAIALAAAAIDYHRREEKSYWQEHFARLRDPIDEFADTKDVFVVERASVERDWTAPVGRARTWSRELRLSLRPAPGSKLKAGGPIGPLLYEFPAPLGLRDAGYGSRGYTSRVSLDDVETTPTGFEVLVTEKVPAEEDAYDALPVVLGPAAPPRAAPQPEAISEWGSRLLDALDEGAAELPADPALDLLRRVPPRGAIAPILDDDTIDAVVTTLLGLDHSSLAVQGPPGTGKTYVGSRVIARLVKEHGWRIGVVAQSHAAVENVLDAVVAAGLAPERVGKEPKDPATFAGEWTPLAKGKAGGLADFTAQSGGFVVGGTAWTFANATKFARRSLDLLVVEEAGQFSLAPTIAASVAATRILLLGDPQQLPQVSQGTHPEPVDQSALGWLADGHDVLPPEFGYFLAHTRRMHAAVCEPVSQLSYAGELSSIAPARSLAGVEPGLHVVPVEHRHNTTSSVEEAAQVVTIALDLMGRPWSSSPTSPPRPLEPGDVIVVAPYNAQVGLLREALDAVGLGETQVGTVDMFQGREAAVAIVSLAASSAADIPRGLEFLLMPNRLNVAISRAQWAAYLVASPGLASGLPRSVGELRLLSGYLRLLDGAVAAGPETATRDALAAV
ncbi:TM0106 family RecB-like putative nuclease [Frondihabitans cladoniiphilus]|uniref:TM0106 family RecB-like putative nuclease n=1 Tax=Frondihabitans cladoniiphilus TaxID=715785 RepID=UPI0031E79D60